MPNLPPCDYRVETERSDVCYCRHARVHAAGHLVTPGVCRVCTQREVPCETPRPLNRHDNPPNNAATKPPSLWKQAWNVTQAVAAFTADGFTTVDSAEYQRRLSICDGCDQRNDNRCLQCGCRLSLKARGRAFRCPLGKWEAQPTTSDSAKTPDNPESQGAAT